MAKPSVRDMERVKRIGRSLAGKPESKVLVLPIGEATKPLDDRCRWTLPQGMDQEAASGVTVHRRERVVRRSQNRIRRVGDPGRGEGPGDSMWAELTAGCLSDDVLGQSQRIGQGESRRHAKTCGYRRHPSQKKIRHEEGRHEREPRRLDDEADAETEHRAAYDYCGL